MLYAKDFGIKTLPFDIDLSVESSQLMKIQMTTKKSSKCEVYISECKLYP